MFLPAHNARFAIVPDEGGTAFVPFAGDLRDILCVHEDRVVGNDNTVPGLPLDDLAVVITEAAIVRGIQSGDDLYAGLPLDDLAVVITEAAIVRGIQSGDDLADAAGAFLR